MYFPVVEPATSRLLALRMVPMRIGKMRLGRASPAEAEWLRGRLSGVCGPFGSHVEKAARRQSCPALAVARSPGVTRCRRRRGGDDSMMPRGAARSPLMTRTWQSVPILLR